MRRERDNRAISLDADSSTAVLQITVFGCSNVCRNLTVLDKQHVATDSSLDVIQRTIGIADNRRTVLQNCKEIATVGAMLDVAVHNQGAHRLARGHIEEVGIDARDHRFAGFRLIACGLRRRGRQAPRVGAVISTIAGNDLRRRRAFQINLA